RDSDRPLVAFCGGSGVTPVMSIAKSVIATTARPLRLLFANRDERSVIFRDELDALQGRHADQLRVQHHFASDAGFLNAGAIAAFVETADWCHFHVSSRTVLTPVDADFYICGPGPFMDLVESTLLDLGVP